MYIPVIHALETTFPVTIVAWSAKRPLNSNFRVYAANSRSVDDSKASFSASVVKAHSSQIRTMTDQPSSATAKPLAFVVMGVAGSGKTTTSTLLSEALGAVYEEGDGYHPQSNVEKMKQGQPLNDDDREPWLRTIAERIQFHLSEGRSVVFACSALKEKYRALLSGGSDQVKFLFLTAPESVIRERMSSRVGHFMPPSLMASQFAALEAPEPSKQVCVVDVSNKSPQDVIADVQSWITAL